MLQLGLRGMSAQKVSAEAELVQVCVQFSFCPDFGSTRTHLSIPEKFVEKKLISFVGYRWTCLDTNPLITDYVFNNKIYL